LSICNIDCPRVGITDLLAMGLRLHLLPLLIRLSDHVGITDLLAMGLRPFTVDNGLTIVEEPVGITDLLAMGLRP